MTKRLGMLQYFLDQTVQIATDIEQQQIDVEGEVTFAKLAYQGVLLDFDDQWVVLGYYDTDEVPVIVAMIKIGNIVALMAGEDSGDLTISAGSSEVN